MALSVWKNQSEYKRLQTITDYTTPLFLLSVWENQSEYKGLQTITDYSTSLLIYLYGKNSQNTKGYRRSLTIPLPYCFYLFGKMPTCDLFKYIMTNPILIALSVVWENQSEN